MSQCDVVLDDEKLAALRSALKLGGVAALDEMLMKLVQDDFFPGETFHKVRRRVMTAEMRSNIAEHWRAFECGLLTPTTNRRIVGAFIDQFERAGYEHDLHLDMQFTRRLE